MYRRFQDRFGTAGVVIGVIALVIALGGSALAASGALTGKQKKEVEKIAKRSGKPGPQGPQGPAGAAGAAGKDGANGTNGTNGKDGTNGTGVTTKHLNPGEGPPGEECEEGGTELTSASGVEVLCNGEEGEEGEPGPAGPAGPPGPTCQANGVCALPVGATMTGVWAFSTSNVERAYVSISFPLRYISDEAPFAIYVTRSEQEAGGTAECPSDTYETPKAEPGYLCLYESRELSNAEPPFPAVAGDPSSGVTLASFLVEPSEEAEGAGTWALTR
jgi:hypothetical protein